MTESHMQATSRTFSIKVPVPDASSSVYATFAVFLNTFSMQMCYGPTYEPDGEDNFSSKCVNVACQCH